MIIIIIIRDFLWLRMRPRLVAERAHLKLNSHSSAWQNLVPHKGNQIYYMVEDWAWLPCPSGLHQGFFISVNAPVLLN